MERIWKKMIGALGFTLCMALAACSDYLDVSNEIAESLDLEAVFRNPAYTRQWHANLFNCISEYSCTGGNNASGFTNVWSSLCGETLISSGPSSRLMEAGYNSSNAPLHRWWVLYREIRDAFIFLKRVTPLGAVEDEQQLTEESVRRMKAEAKFLIAYSYFSLFELYGPVPLLTEEVDPESKDLNFPRATVDEKEEIRQLLELCDQDFVPPLSHRNSTSQTNWAETEEKTDGIAEYLENICSQHVVLWKEEGVVRAFMTWKDHFNCENLEAYPDSCYLTTLCVWPDYRGQGISEVMYAEAEKDIAAKFPGSRITLRTWSTNGAQEHILDKLGYSLVRRLKDDRGEGIDTVYFVKKEENDR